MQPSGLGPDMFGNDRGKGDDVVLDGLLDFVDAVGVKSAAFADGFGGLAGNDARFRHNLGGRYLNLQPRFKSLLVAPEATHLRMGVSGNHQSRFSLSRPI
jgi:hypothetical protein